MRGLGVLLILLLSASLSASAALGQPADDDREDIRATFESWRKAANAGDADGFLTHVRDDAIFADMAPGMAPIVGKGALRPFFKDFFATFTLTWSDCQSQEVVLIGDLAFHRYTGVLTVTPKQGGEPSRDNRRYLDLLRRDADGRWRVWQHIFTVMPPVDERPAQRARQAGDG
jgi:uncharacterized protein (TIGR02246 family)